MTREQWLEEAAVEVDRTILAALTSERWGGRVSVGFPKGRHGRGKAIGQCWPTTAAQDARSQVFVSPELHEATDVLATLLHELIHAADNCKSRHKGNFAKIAKAAGLKPPLTSSTPGEELSATLKAIAARLPEYPHSRLNVRENARRPGSRLRLYSCPTCGQKVRVASDDWLAVCTPCNEAYMRN